MDSSSIALWLAIIAVATAVQSLVVLVGAFVLARRVRQAEAAFWSVTTDLRERVERTSAVVEKLAVEAQPVMARTSQALDDLSDLAKRARRAEADVRATIGRASIGLDFAKAAVTARAWPVVGLAKGLAAGLRVVRSRRTARARRDDAQAVARFVNEGGLHE
jgi:hypothetical protein